MKNIIVLIIMLIGSSLVGEDFIKLSYSDNGTCGIEIEQDVEFDILTIGANGQIAFNDTWNTPYFVQTLNYTLFAELDFNGYVVGAEVKTYVNIEDGSLIDYKKLYIKLIF